MLDQDTEKQGEEGKDVSGGRRAKDQEKARM